MGSLVIMNAWFVVALGLGTVLFCDAKSIGVVYLSVNETIKQDI